MPLPRFEYIPHTSEFHIRVYGKSLEELFSNALYGFSKIIKEKLPKRVKVKRKIRLKAENLELLLAYFLQEIVYLVDVHNEVYIDVKFDKLTEKEIVGWLKGVKVEDFDEEIKGVAYDGLKVSKEDKIWVAEIVFDV